jgi:hypothetical protein
VAFAALAAACLMIQRLTVGLAAQVG